MGATLAVTGLILGVGAVILAVAVKEPWAKPAAAALLVLALVGEGVAVQASTNGGGSGTLPTAGPTAPTPSVSTSPSSVPTSPIVVPTVFNPHLLSAVHPGSGAVTKPQQINREFVRLLNKANHAVTITGWRLSNKAGTTFTFPAFTLQRNATVVVHTGAGTASATDLYWGLSGFIWNTKDTATLRNASGAVINTCTYVLQPTAKAASCG